MIRIIWRSKTDGAICGHGEWFPDSRLVDLEAMKNYQNKKYPTLSREIETRPNLVEFIALGYFQCDDDVEPSAKGIKKPFVLIRDDDAAAAGAESCYFAALTPDEEQAVLAYEDGGGTVSYSRVIR